LRSNHTGGPSSTVGHITIGRRPVLRVKELKKTSARSGLARSAAKTQYSSMIIKSSQT
jgi:hypothetical protein